MILTDDTVTATPKTKSKAGPKGRLQPWFCGHSVYASEWAAHDCPKKREELAERECARAECREQFSPKRPGQRFHTRNCARKDMSERRLGKANKAQSARKGLTPEQIQAMEMAPIVATQEAVAQQANRYTPLMGEALYTKTMELMR